MTAYFAAMCCGRLIGSRLVRHLRPQSSLTGAFPLAFGATLVFWIAGPTRGAGNSAVRSGPGRLRSLPDDPGTGDRLCCRQARRRRGGSGVHRGRWSDAPRARHLGLAGRSGGDPRPAFALVPILFLPRRRYLQVSPVTGATATRQRFLEESSSSVSGRGADPPRQRRPVLGPRSRQSPFGVVLRGDRGGTLARVLISTILRPRLDASIAVSTSSVWRASAALVR